MADDAYVLSDCPRKLQGAIDIVGHYGKRYRVVFGASKTKATVTGSKIDMQYYKDIKMRKLYGEQIDVTEDNEHLGLIVSGQDEEAKHVDENITQCRSSLFAILSHSSQRYPPKYKFISGEPTASQYCALELLPFQSEQYKHNIPS